MVAEKVVVQLVLDTSRYTSGASNAARSTAKIQTAADKTSKSVSSLGSTALKAGAALGAAFAAKAALNFAKSSIAAFSSLSESVNAVEVSFGDAAEGVFELGENSAEQFGLSTRAVNQAAVAMSAFADKIDEADPADAFGNVLQRATDFASVMDIDVEEALILFRSGLAGESEPLRKFGIDVSAATVTAVGLAAGLGGVNGKLDEGEKVQARYLAIMEQTEKTAGDFANTSEGLANRQRTLSAQWEEMQATVGEELEPAMIKLLSAGTKLIPIFGKLGVALAGSVDRFLPLIDLLAFFADQFDDSSKDVEKSGERFSLVPSQITDEFDKFFRFVGQSFPQQGAAIIDFFRGTVMAAENLGTALDNVDPSVFDGDLQALGITLVEVSTAFRINTEVQEAAISPTAQYARVVNNARAFADSAAAAEERRAAGIRSVLAAQAEAASPALRLLRAQQGLVAAQERLEEVRGAEKIKDVDRVEAVLALADAQAGLEAATANISGRVGDSIDAVTELGTTAGATTEEMELLLETFGLFPTSIDVDFNIRGTASISEIGQILREVSGIPTFIGPRRHGGPVAADEPFIVGEGGPELFIPDRTGRIIPNKAFGEQSIVVNVNDPTTTDLAADLSAGLIAAQITQQVELLRT